MKEVATRKIDELGRIVIPIQIREQLNIQQKDSFDISVENGKIIIEFANPKKCIFCNSTTDLKNFSDNYICSECQNNISELN